MAATSFTEPYIVTENGMNAIREALEKPSPLENRDIPRIHVCSPAEMFEAAMSATDPKDKHDR